MGTVAALINLHLLILRAVWRSSSRVVDGLYWPNVVAAGVLGFGAIAALSNTVWLARQRVDMDIYSIGLGGYFFLMCLLTVFVLRRTNPREQTLS